MRGVERRPRSGRRVDRARRSSSDGSREISVREVEALDVAHRDEQVLVRLAGLVDRDHVRVVDRRGGLPLALEALAEETHLRRGTAASSLRATRRPSAIWSLRRWPMPPRPATASIGSRRRWCRGRDVGPWSRCPPGRHRPLTCSTVLTAAVLGRVRPRGDGLRLLPAHQDGIQEREQADAKHKGPDRRVESYLPWGETQDHRGPPGAAGRAPAGPSTRSAERGSRHVEVATPQLLLGVPRPSQHFRSAVLTGRKAGKEQLESSLTFSLTDVKLVRSPITSVARSPAADRAA